MQKAPLLIIILSALLLCIIVIPIHLHGMPEKSELRKFDDSSINELKNDDAFFYMQQNKSKTDYRSMFYNWFLNMLSKIFGNKVSRFILGNIHYIIMIIAIGLILYKITGVSFQGTYSKPGTNIISGITDNINVEEVNFIPLINKAVNNGDYRSAIRYQYLNILKQLSHYDLISFGQHKTNVEYIYELKEKQITDGFKEVVYIFDNVWYGDNHISNNDYDILLPYFVTVKEMISKTGNK